MTEAGPGPADQPGTDQAKLARKIELQRAELSETVHALTAKLDVKHRATEGTKSLLDEARRTVRSRPAVTVGAATGLIAFLMFMRKVRRR